MTGEFRELYYVGREMPPDLESALAKRRWTVDSINFKSGCNAAHRRDLAGAGIVDFSGVRVPQDLQIIEQWLACSRVGWVAIGYLEQFNDAVVRGLIRNYCFDYVTLPTSNERIANAVGHAHGMVTLSDEASDGGRAVEGDETGGMIGSCDAMLGLFRSIRKVATTDAPVFIYGESGTGKELTAAAIHERSTRCDQPFVAINCGAIPAHLLQSELFGYERGAFTGANQRKIGRVEAANGGTLFLDEIGDLPLESQASLLRFLQERKVERLGGHGSTPVDVRVISATHVDMQTAMIEGRFRADLYHRLCVLQVNEPPLRERGKDIEKLAHHMLERFKTDARRRLRGFSSCAIAALYTYGWPGNVRELINRVRRAIVMAEGRQITARDLELEEHVEAAPITLAQAREAAERQTIEMALLRHRGRLGEAAQELGISRVTLYRLLNAHGLRSEEIDDRGTPSCAKRSAA
ncbi:sigma-54 dependent transcription regulator [Caballeronia arationis]|uniref:sigma-54 dependent transcriptional regulator n=1 Tax=Caballeronia arationis TaxID=1777142 RepID=UPI00074C4989|nr:sigma-54 dependent transcriptional regulator [Caballeronia arationis]SAL07372.1 sigma-54 dependent transcription regulator [Caballeronia arationis]